MSGFGPQTLSKAISKPRKGTTTKRNFHPPAKALSTQNRQDAVKVWKENFIKIPEAKPKNCWSLKKPVLSAEHSALAGLIILKHGHSFNKRCMWKLSPAWSGPQLKSMYRGQGWRETSKHPHWLLTYWLRQNSQKVRPSLSLPDTHYFIIMEKSFTRRPKSTMWWNQTSVGPGGASWSPFPKAQSSNLEEVRLNSTQSPTQSLDLVLHYPWALREREGRNNGKWK